MSKSLLEYISWLHTRDDLIWPEVSEPQPLRARATLKPIPQIKAVLWSVYGTLLHVQEGQLLLDHPHEIRMQVALEKTIEEFKMWYSMHREPGAPWEGMLRQYRRVLQQLEMAPTKRKGDKPHLDSAKIWSVLLNRLIENEYEWDESIASSAEDLAVKVSYFFHAMLQGTRIAARADEVLLRLRNAHVRNGLLADSQRFTVAQLLNALGGADRLAGVDDLLSPTLLVESWRYGIRKPSETLFARAAHQVGKLRLEPEQVLYVSHRIQDDIAVANDFGFFTALYAGDKASCQATPAELKDPDTRPDRLITDLFQVIDIVGA